VCRELRPKTVVEEDTVVPQTLYFPWRLLNRDLNNKEVTEDQGKKIAAKETTKALRWR
jgi:hypothetical protein